MPLFSCSPIHMAVLMRKADLVRRYCCILQVLESSVDLVNDDKMVSHNSNNVNDISEDVNSSTWDYVLAQPLRITEHGCQI